MSDVFWIDLPQYPIVTLEETLVKQAPTEGGWICPGCVNYEGGCKCAKNVFIGMVGANMKGCHAFQEGRKCRHCGRMT